MALCLGGVPLALCLRRERFRRCQRVIEFDDGFWLFGVLRWGSPSGPSRPLALTPALSRPAGEGEKAPLALCFRRERFRRFMSDLARWRGYYAVVDVLINKVEKFPSTGCTGNQQQDALPPEQTPSPAGRERVGVRVRRRVGVLSAEFVDLQQDHL